MNELEGYPRTHTMVTVSAVCQGAAQVGDSLEVVEEGALPPMRGENSYVLFLTGYQGAWTICGAFQGRFIEREGYLFQQATADTKLKDYSPLPAADFAARLEEVQ